MENVLFGLDERSSEEEIRRLVFRKAHESRYFSISTIPAKGNMPGARILDFMCSEDDGLLYFGVGTGKPCNTDLEANPVVTLSGAFVGEDNGESEHRSLVSFRITGKAEKAANPAAVEEYWKRNPGSRKMWSRSMESFAIYCIPCGEGELYQVYRNDGIYRIRFGFGGCPARPFMYQVDPDRCIGCGACAEACTAGIMEIGGGKARIPHEHCYECGVCMKHCPNGAIYSTCSNQKEMKA